MSVDTKTIDEITRTLTNIAGTERIVGRDGSGDFKITALNFLKNVPGNFSVATNKFTVAAATGNTVVAGTLFSADDFVVAVYKDKRYGGQECQVY